MGVSLVFNTMICLLILQFMNKLMMTKDKRMSLSQDMVNGMKSLKYLNWESIFYEKIVKIRQSEFWYIKIFQISAGVFIMFWSNISYILLYTFITEYTKSINMTIKESGANIYVIISIVCNLNIFKFNY
jgi:hypothetical protein